MKTIKQAAKAINNESGALLVDVITALTISGMLMMSLAFTYLNATRSYHDQNIKIQTQLQTNGLLSSLVYELKIAGAGMPLSQSNFAMSNASLGDASIPIMSNADASNISLKLNDSGESTVLSTDYSPAPANLSFNVSDPSIFQDGDIVYISNLERGGEDGMLAEISDILLSTISIDSAYTASASANFETGSSVQAVKTISYSSPADWSGITRDEGSGEMLVLPGSKFTLDYQDIDGNSLSLPLSRGDIANNLSSIIVSVSVQSTSPLKDGSTYLASAEQRVFLKNLNLARE